jgi:predicted nucleic acid-binding protein
MQPVLFDASIYIPSLRVRDDAALNLGRIAGGGPIWLSSVVLEELFAGVTAQHRRVVERLEHDFERIGRILVPNLSDWTQTGKILARLAEEYGHEQIGRGRLTNDALLAMSAGRLGITVITAGARDFGMLAEFRRFQWRVSDPRTS